MRLLLLLMACLLICGCNATATRPDKVSQANVLDLRQKADQAYQKQDWANAAKFYEQLARTDSASVESWFRLGNSLERLNNSDAAVNAYREALFHDPSNTRVWHNLGIVRLRQATNAFIELQNRADDKDPLKQNAADMVHAIEQVLQQQTDTGDGN